LKILLVNHVITAVKAMLVHLVETEVITDLESRELLPVIVLHAIKDDSIEIDTE